MAQHDMDSADLRDTYRTVTLHHPSRGYTPADCPCPTCGRYGGTPDLAHGGEGPAGYRDDSLAGLRCVAERLAEVLAGVGPEGIPAEQGEAECLARYLADVLADLDRAAGGV